MAAVVTSGEGRSLRSSSSCGSRKPQRRSRRETDTAPEDGPATVPGAVAPLSAEASGLGAVSVRGGGASDVEEVADSLAGAGASPIKRKRSGSSRARRLSERTASAGLDLHPGACTRNDAFPKVEDPGTGFFTKSGMPKETTGALGSSRTPGHGGRARGEEGQRRRRTNASSVAGADSVSAEGATPLALEQEEGGRATLPLEQEGDGASCDQAVAEIGTCNSSGSDIIEQTRPLAEGTTGEGEGGVEGPMAQEMQAEHCPASQRLESEPALPSPSLVSTRAQRGREPPSCRPAHALLTAGHPASGASGGRPIVVELLDEDEDGKGGQGDDDLVVLSPSSAQELEARSSAARRKVQGGTLPGRRGGAAGAAGGAAVGGGSAGDGGRAGAASTGVNPLLHEEDDECKLLFAAPARRQHRRALRSVAGVAEGGPSIGGSSPIFFFLQDAGQVGATPGGPQTGIPQPLQPASFLPRSGAPAGPLPVCNHGAPDVPPSFSFAEPLGLEGRAGVDLQLHLGLHGDRSLRRLGHDQPGTPSCLPLFPHTKLGSAGALPGLGEPGAKAPAPAEGVSALKLKCPICLDVVTEETVTTCGHVFCKECITLAVQAKKCCPTCRKKLGKSNMHRVYLS